MENTARYIPVGNRRLHYLEWGSGKRLLLAFHGYGNDAGMFRVFNQYLADAFTILSFDLPHHGGSRWDNGTLLKKSELVNAVQSLMTTYGVSKVSLMGYSMGGRVCMSLVEQMPAAIDAVLLMATDGLAVNRLYYFCTRTLIGNMLFRSVLRQPRQYIPFIRLLKKTGLLDPTRYKFVMQHLQSEENRKFLLDAWPAMSDFIPRPARLKKTIRQCRIRIFIIMGVYDRLMPPRLAEQFRDGMETVQVFIFEKGHRVFDDANAQEIATKLLQP